VNCKKVNQLLVSYLDNEVSPEEREAIQAHLSACYGCREELGALAETQRELRQGLNIVAAGASAPSHAWSAVKERTEAAKRNGIPILEALKSRVRGMISRLGPRPVWQKALASVLTVAIVAGLCLGIPALSKQSPSGGQNGLWPVPSSEFSPSPGPSGSSDQNGLPRFASYDDLQEFVNAHTQSLPSYAYANRGSVVWNSTTGAPQVLFDVGVEAGSVDYSTTNIQVAGVDEADIVKTDGEFIYLVSGTKLVIVKAYPPEKARVLSRIDLGQEPTGIFINGNMLVVLEDTWESETSASSYQTSIKVYDVTDRENPDLVRDVSVDGQYFGARMIGDYAYVIVGEPVYYNNEIRLPEVYLGDSAKEIPATDIYYFEASDSSYGFTTILAVNTQNAVEEPSRETILLGATSNLYVSANNIYIAVTDWEHFVSGSESTSIHRIHIDQGKIEYKANGEVPGRVLDQFSMDEYQSFFRVATTSWEQTESEGVVTSQSQNNVYILSMDLDIVGRLENLAPGESIYSSRFMGERCYLVTFKQVDPFFVIDLGDPYNPEVLGALKITGYSDYLHPYDENHIIGIGKETVDAGDFAWYQGVKISLFDVTDVSNPKEVAKYEIGDRGSDSPVLTDHRALLFDRSKNLLVMPVSVIESGSGDSWQGAYVFHISVDDGIQYRGRITHYGGDVGQGYYPFSPFSGKMVPAMPIYGSYSPYAVTRSLYIGDVLYTVSEMKIKMNSLESLDLINEIAVG
jgi:uncharacterized secreted protein with C-terminal beta-propeller domain